MRLTTKIVLSIFLSLFLLSFCFIIGLKFVNKERGSNPPNLSQENMTAVAIAPYRTIRIDEIQKTSDEEYYIVPFGTFRLKPIINTEDGNKLYLPEELLQFTDISFSGDTLIISLKTDELRDKFFPERETQSRHHTIYDVYFFMHTNTVDVICNLDGIQVEVQNIIADTIRINTGGNIVIDSCRANIIEPTMRRNWKSFLLTNSQVKELNIDLDKTGNSRQIRNCDIEVENLTGSGNHRTDLTKNEAKIMNWIPKDNDAQLTVTLHGDTTQIVFP